MNNKDYWNERAKQRFLMGEKTADELLQTMKPVYKNCLADINKEIEAFYGRYAENNQLTITEVNKRLDPKQLQSAKEEIKKYYDTVDKLARNKDGTVDVNLLHQYKNELRLQSAKAYMSRLEELKLNLKNITVNLGVEESKAYYQTLSKIYADTYKKTSYDMDKFFGFSAGFEGLNYKKLNSAIHQQWLGMNFSDRIWNNKGKLLDQINTTFLQGVAQGHNPRKIAETMSKNMGTAYYNCERLCRTESAHIMGEATLQGYKDRGTEKYKFEATLDDRTSDICQSLDGQVFELKEAQEGVNYPPMHPNCRSTTVPYFEPDDIDKMFDEAQRVARDENGELYYVPASMSYEEWEQTVTNKNNSIVIPKINYTESEIDGVSYWTQGNDGWGYANMRMVANGAPWEETPLVEQQLKINNESKANYIKGKLQEYQKGFESAVNKAPAPKGELTRVTNILKVPKLGEEIKFEKFSSFTFNPTDVLYENFGSQGGVIFKLKSSKNFADISQIGRDSRSFGQQEWEAISKKAMTYKVSKIVSEKILNVEHKVVYLDFVKTDKIIQREYKKPVKKVEQKIDKNNIQVQMKFIQYAQKVGIDMSNPDLVAKEFDKFIDLLKLTM